MQLCLNLGISEGFLKNNANQIWYNIDKFMMDGVDIIRDIEKQCLPFTTSTIDFIQCKNTLNYIDDLIFVMNEMWRVLKPGGFVSITYKTSNTPVYKNTSYVYNWSYFNDQNSKYKYIRKIKNILASFYIGQSYEYMDTTQIKLICHKNQSINSFPIFSSIDVAKPNNQSGAIKLDIGCGNNKRNDTPGWIGVDKNPDSQADIIIDFEKLGLPFPDKSIDFIYTSHTLEHINNLIYVMEEFYRILKKDGILEIIVPHYQSADALRHPDHKRLFHQELWSFWDPDILQDDRKSYNVKARFKIVQDSISKTTLNMVVDGGLFTTLRKV